MKKLITYGLATLAGLSGIGANANADTREKLEIQATSPYNQKIVEIVKREGATENYDNGMDNDFLAPPSFISPRVDFYSNVDYDPWKLKTIAKGLESMTTDTTRFEGVGLENPVNVNLAFKIYNAVDNRGAVTYIPFEDKNIFLDLKGSGTTVIGTYDIREMARLHPYPETALTISVPTEGFYDLEVRYEVPSADLNGDGNVNTLDLALLSENWLKTTEESRLKRTADITRDGTVNLADFSVMANQWLFE